MFLDFFPHEINASFMRVGEQLNVGKKSGGMGEESVFVP